MRQYLSPVFGRAVLLCAFAGFFAAPSRAQSAVEKLYKDKCEICHGKDGKGETDMGKKVGVRDFHSPQVQKETDAQLIEITMKGKKKMPGYQKRISDDEIKQLVAFMRDLSKKK